VTGLPNHTLQFSQIQWNFLRPSTSKFFTKTQIQRQHTFVGESRAILDYALEARELIRFSPLQIIKMSNAELAVSYAALILADDGVDVTVRFLSSRKLAMGLLWAFDRLLMTYRPIN
jgi:hypothetical protein